MVTAGLALAWVVTLIADSRAFKGFRTWVTERSRTAGYGISCHMCLMWWMTLIMGITPGLTAREACAAGFIGWCALKVIGAVQWVSAISADLHEQLDLVLYSANMMCDSVAASARSIGAVADKWRGKTTP